MPPLPIPGRLSYRLLNANTGSVVVPDLPHLHASTWTVRALQQGLPGSATIGDFTIPIPPATSAEYRRNKAIYDLVTATPGLRVEASPGDVPTASPRFTGIATKVRPGFDRWEIAGPDSLFWLQQSQLFPGEVLGAGGATSALVNNLRSTREVIWDDKFATWNGGGFPSSLQYTSTGFTFVAADPQFGQPAITAAATNPSKVVTNSTWTAAQQFNWPTPVLAASMTSIEGVIFAGTDTTTAGTAEVFVLADSTLANGYAARLRMAQTGAGTGLYTVFAEIHTWAAGVATLQASTTALTNVPATLPFEVNAVLYNLGSNHVLRCIVNGKDSGCTYSFATGPSPASGGVGARFGYAAGGSPTIYLNSLKFESRPVPANWGSARFGAGTISTGVTLGENISSSSQTHLDLLLLCSTLDGFFLRKNPGAGVRGDTLDYGASPGTDHSDQQSANPTVVFEEGVNLEMSGTKVLPVADTFALSARVNAIPGGTSGGTFDWSALQQAGDMVLVDTVSDLGVPGYALLAAYARLIAARKANPLQCIQVAVVRTADTADKWRELDFVTVHIPSLGIIRQKAQVMGYTYTEGSALQTVWLNQFPDHFVQGPLHRMARSIEWMTGIISPR